MSARRHTKPQPTRTAPKLRTPRAKGKGPVLPDAVTGFLKADAEKVRYELLPSHALHQVAQVFTFGAKKYADENYLKGAAWRRYLGAGLRHLHAFARGEDNDAETGLSHLAHLCCCALMLLELQRVGTGTDDRVKGVSQLEDAATVPKLHATESYERPLPTFGQPWDLGQGLRLWVADDSDNSGTYLCLMVGGEDLGLADSSYLDEPELRRELARWVRLRSGS